MKIAITSTGKNLEANIDPRFGRTTYFIIINPETMEYEVVDNKQNLDLPHGAGIQAGKIIVDNKVDVLITGQCGPKAFFTMNKAGVKIITDVKGRVIDAVTKYKNNELKLSSSPNAEGHN